MQTSYNKIITKINYMCISNKAIFDHPLEYNKANSKIKFQQIIIEQFALNSCNKELLSYT